MGGKGGGSKSTGTQTTTSAPPGYIADAYKDVLAQAENVYGLPLQQYGGPQLAGFTPDQNASFDTIRDANGAWAPYLSSASNLVNSATGGYTPRDYASNVSSYMNPYDDNVVNAFLDDSRRGDATAMQDTVGNAIAAGAWGGSGAQDAQSALSYEQAKARNSGIAQIRNQGYESAANKFFTDESSRMNAANMNNSTALQGAGIMAGLGTEDLRNRLSQAEAQGSAGGTQQNLVQQQLNIPYEQFLQQQAFPYEQLQYYANIAASLGGGAGGTTTGTGTAPGQKSSGLGNAIGTAATIASLFASDRRVKKDIKQVGELDNELPVYSFKYKGDDRTQIGLMAQDVEKENPGAVHEIGGIKHVDYSKAVMRDGGRVMPSITGRDKSHGGGIVPTDGFVTAHLGAPAATPMPSPANSGSSSAMPFTDLSGLGGFRTFGSPDQNWDFGDNFSMGARADKAYAAKGGFGPYRFARGGIVHAGMCYADGGAVEPTVDPQEILTGSGTPVAGFKPVVAGTPVYAFNPLAAKAQAVTIPDRIPKLSQEEIAAKQAAKTKSSAPIGYGDFAALMLTNPQSAQQFGYYNGEPGGGGGNNSNFQQYIPQMWSTYQANPSKYTFDNIKGFNFANGGIVGYNTGGAILDMNDTGMSIPGGGGMAPGAEYLKRQPVLPAALQKNAGISYIPNANANRASLAAPGIMSMPKNANLDDLQTIMDSDANMFGAGPVAGGYSAPTGTITEFPENKPSNPDAAGITGLNLGKRMERAMTDPARAAAFFGGTSMIGLPTDDPWVAVGHGLRSAATAYGGVNKAKKDAAADASKLWLETEKLKKDLAAGDYQAVEGEDDVLILDKKTGELKPTGQKPKKNKGTAIDVSPNDMYGIEDLALGMIPGAMKGDKVNPKVYDMVENRNAALAAASEAYQKSRNSNEAAKVYLQTAGIDPDDSELAGTGWFDGWTRLEKGDKKKDAKKEDKSAPALKATVGKIKGQTVSEADIEATAAKHNITPDQVRAKLGIK